MKKTWMMAKESRKTSWQWLVVGLLALTTFLAPNLAAGPIAALTGNACQQTAVAALTSCKAAAQSDYKLALGKAPAKSSARLRTIPRLIRRTSSPRSITHTFRCGRGRR